MTRLGQLQSRNRESEYLVAHLKHRDIDMRWKAARLLGEMRGQGIDLLMKALYDDDRGVRLLAAWALGKTKDIRAADALIRASPDENSDVQLAIDGAIQRLSRTCIVAGSFRQSIT